MAHGWPPSQAALAQALPGADVRMLHAVAETEANVVLKIRSTLFLLTAADSGHHHAVRDQQLQRAGARAQQGNRHHESHRRGREKDRGAVSIRVADSGPGLGTAAGYGAGLLVAWWIGRQIFPESAAAGVGVNYGVFVPVTVVTLAMAAAATLAAAARIWRIQPAVILRGE